MENHNKARISLAGEFAVLSQLALRGKDANMTLGNTKGVDILVSDPVTGRMIKLEVKTNYREKNKSEVTQSEVFGKFLSGKSWILSEKNGEYNNKHDANLFYCFVNIIKETNVFKFYIVPAKVVSQYIRDENKLWHEEKKKEGKLVKTSDMRQFRLGIKGEKYKIKTPIGDDYEDNWEFK
jgi:hypothetical protein